MTVEAHFTVVSTGAGGTFMAAIRATAVSNGGAASRTVGPTLTNSTVAGAINTTGTIL